MGSVHWCIRGQSRSALQAARAILEHWLSKDENTEIINKDLETAGRAKFGSQACKFVMHDVDRVESTYSGLVAKACCVLWWLPVMRTAAQQSCVSWVRLISSVPSPMPLFPHPTFQRMGWTPFRPKISIPMTQYVDHSIAEITCA